MSTEPNDSKARQRALSLAHSFIVQAPAGSGKTGLLVRRVLKLLTIVEQPEEILAITFTRKATAEMRQRVLESLQKAAQGRAFEAHEQDLKAFAEQVLQRDQQKGWQLLQQNQRLRIQTIDALCANLVRQMPWSTRFGAMPQIESQIRDLCEQAALRTLKKIERGALSVSTAIHTLLLELGGDINQLKRHLATLLLDRNRYLPLLFDHAGSLQNRSQLEQHWKERVESHLKSCADALTPLDRDRIMNLGRYAANELPENNQHSPICELKTTTRFPQAQIAALAIWLGIAELLLTKKGDFRKTITVKEGFAAKTLEKLEMVALLEDLAEDSHLRTQLEQIRHLPDAQFHDGQWALLEALIQVLPDAASELYLLFGETGRSDFSELTYRAIEALGDEENPTDLALIQDYRTQHILMDEFQDTSPQQLDLLERLTAGWTANDGRSVFLVGDPMQSIYRFREADVRVFLHVCEHGVGGIKTEFLQLSANFRSSATLINWVNTVFPDVLPQRNNLDLGAVSYTAAEPIHINMPGEVLFHPLIDAARSDEAAAIVVLIQEKIKQASDADIAVLGRSRSRLIPIAEALRRAGVAFEAIELESLIDQPVAQDLLTLSRALLHPFDRIAWLSLLRAPWCGLTLADLLLFSNSEVAIEQVICDPQRWASANPDAQKRLQTLAQQLAPILVQRGKVPLSYLLREAWQQLNGAACIDAAQLEHAALFFKTLSAIEAEGITLNVCQLEKRITVQKVSSPPQAIKLMTMHKAKGLEYETVILAGLDGRASGRPERALLRWEVVDQHLLIAPIMPIGMAENRHDAYLKQFEAERDRFEAGRLLYVAATRARQSLHLFASLKTDTKGLLRAPVSGSLLKLIWDQTADDWQTASAVPLTNSEGQNARHCLLRLPTNYTPPTPPITIQLQSKPRVSGDIEYDWAREIARLVGIVVHQYLENASQASLKNWKTSVDQTELRQRLIHAGVLETDIPEASQRVQKLLCGMAYDTRAEWLFNEKHQETKAEWTLTGVVSGTVRHIVIDRSFIDDKGVRWIIDFKTGHHQGGDNAQFLDQEQSRYQGQLNRYARVVAAVTTPPAEGAIRCGLYFPAMNAWREWQPKS